MMMMTVAAVVDIIMCRVSNFVVAVVAIRNVEKTVNTTMTIRYHRMDVIV